MDKRELEFMPNHPVLEDFKEWVYKQKIDKVGENYTGRYCVAISVDDILQKIYELELKYAKVKKNREE